MQVSSVLNDPEWLPHRLGAAGATVEFRHAPREVHRAVTFLDDDNLKGRPVASVPTRMLSPSSPVARPLHFIFHSAFSCSTLLTRALDIPGVAMGLKEPAILNDLAAQHRARRPMALLDPILALLDRPFALGEAIVAKPSNVANPLIEPILSRRRGTRALLLHAPLRVFLVSIAKKGMWGRIWIRKFYAMLRADPAFEPGFGPDDLFAQTDLQIAALAWLQQQAQFAALLARFGNRLRALDSETLLARRADTLMAIGHHFDLAIDAVKAAAIVAGPAFGKHAKRLGEDYDDRTRAAENVGVDAAHAQEIDMIVKWADAIAVQFAIPTTLGEPLLGDVRP